METESESIDISSIKIRALAPLWAAEQGSRHQIHAAQSAPQKATSQGALGNNNEHLASTVETSAFPSTVPESAVIDAVLQSLPHEAIQQIAKKMSSQNDATQELSPSVLDLIVSKSRSMMVRHDETQHTLNEGDEGHIDITSSFVQQDGDGDEEEAEVEESQPVEFSPTQTQSRLPHFPESQRFKTPMTAGRKRDSSGNTKQTPDLPRPDLRNGAPTPAHVMGLSQAFAATQAATSPFINGIANPLSDRPSPGVDLEVRPATATTSSPMRPISDSRRATTEPASRYVPIAQSQAERYRRALLNLPDDESEDDFSEEPGHVQKKLWERERDEKVKQQIRLLSSPTKRRGRGVPVTKSSPVLPAPRSSLSPAPEMRRASQRSPIEDPLIVDDVDESEAETEQEDEIDDPAQDQSPIIDEEDKENDERVVQIPQTTVRLQKVLNEVPTQVEHSPSLRHDKHQYESSAPVAVANSQPSQPYTRSQRQQPKSSSNSGVDFVPQSQTEYSREGVKATRQAYKEDSHESDDPINDNRIKTQEHHSSAPAQLGGTVPETSSSRQAGHFGAPHADQSIVSRSMSNSNYETAPSRPPPPSSARSRLLEMSSPPIVTTPPGRKRKRMADISANPSPQQSTQGFDPVEALHIDSEVVAVLSQSPIQARTKRLRPQQPIVEILETHTTLSKQSQLPSQKPSVQDDEMAVNAAAEPIVTPQRPAAPQRLGLRRAKLGTATRSRASVWDVEDSPEKLASPTSRQHNDLQTRRTLRKVEQNFDGLPQLIPDAQSPLPNPNPDSGKSQRSARAQQTLRQRKQSQEYSKPTSRSAQETGSFVVARPSGGVILPAPLGEDTPSDLAASTPADEIVAPDMVFACFNGKSRAYYPARCLERVDSEPARYRIQWEGYDPDEIDAYGVRALDIRVGDHVKVDMKGFAKVPYVVRGFKGKASGERLPKEMTDIRGLRTMLVAPKQRKSLPATFSTETDQEAPVAAIYLDSNMWNQMKNRTFDFRPRVSQLVSTSGYATPMERPSTPRTPSSRTRKQIGEFLPSIAQQADGIFANMVFAVSYDDTSKKNAIVDLVRASGGTVVRESFTELMHNDSVVPRSQYAAYGFTALLADKVSRKEKYLQALALGLPCLNGNWIEACIKKESIVDWQTYLLPAGESAALNGAIRSRVMPQMDAASVKLADMLQCRPRPLENANVAIIVGRGKSEVKRKPYLFLIQALGAHTIEKVADLKAAKEATSKSDIDWLFAEDRDVELTRSELRGKAKKRDACNVAGNELIVQSLILGKLYHSD